MVVDREEHGVRITRVSCTVSENEIQLFTAFQMRLLGAPIQ